MLERIYRRPLTVIMLCGGLLLAGLVSLTRLPVRFRPRHPAPALSLRVDYPGQSAQQLEQRVVLPVEKALSRVRGVRRLYSTALRNECRFTILLHRSVNVDLKAAEIRDLINMVRRGFPRECQPPRLYRMSDTDRPVFAAAYRSLTRSDHAVRRWLERTMKPRLERVDGVAEVRIVGGRVRELRVDLDPERLAATALAYSAAARQLDDANTDRTVGIWEQRGREYPVIFKGRFQSAADPGRLPLKIGDRVVPLSRLARVGIRGRRPDSYSLLNGHDRTSLYVTCRPGASLQRVGRRLRSLTTARVPADMEMDISLDEGRDVDRALNQLWGGMVISMLLVSLVLAAYYRALSVAFWVALIIPMSLVTAFTGLRCLGLTLNLISISGLVLGTGILIDAAVVVSDRLCLGPSAGRADAARQVGPLVRPLTVSVLTNAVVFLPVIFLRGALRGTIENIGLSVISVTAAALVFALLFLPLRLTGQKKRPRGSPGWMRRAGHVYLTMLGGVLHRPRLPLIVIAGLTAAGAAAVLMMPRDFTVGGDSRRVRASIEFPRNRLLTDCRGVAAKALGDLRRRWAPCQVSARIEHGHADVEVTFPRPGSRHALRRWVDRYPLPHGYQFYVRGGNDSGGVLRLECFGDDHASLRQAVRRAGGKVAALPGVQHILYGFHPPSRRIILSPRRRRLAVMRTPPGDVAGRVKGLNYGSVVTKYLDDDGEMDVRLRLLPTAGGLRRITLAAAGGKLPLGRLFRRRLETMPTQRTRCDGAPYVSLAINHEGTAAPLMMARVRALFRRHPWPKTMHWRFSDEVEEKRQQLRSIAVMVILAVVAVFMTIAAAFNRVRFALLILLTVPPSLAVSVLPLWLTGTPLTMPVYLGWILCAGLAVNNGVILLSRLDRGSETPYGMLRACRERFRPLTITFITTALSAVPLLLAGGVTAPLFRPLAAVLLGGLTANYALSLLFLPLLYQRFTDCRNR